MYLSIIIILIVLVCMYLINKKLDEIKVRQLELVSINVKLLESLTKFIKILSGSKDD